jgi:hypothetical protein
MSTKLERKHQAMQLMAVVKEKMSAEIQPILEDFRGTKVTTKTGQFTANFRKAIDPIIDKYKSQVFRMWPNASGNISFYIEMDVTTREGDSSVDYHKSELYIGRHSSKNFTYQDYEPPQTIFNGDFITKVTIKDINEKQARIETLKKQIDLLNDSLPYYARVHQ